jgi:uncharacterized protein involved in type VI secretion and phage assembly
MKRDDARQYFGKYRGTVVNTTDPEQRARLQAIVPDVLGTQPSTWALPAVPYAGTGAGFVALPPVGAGVWIEFEQGNPDFPIWCGGWWGVSTDLPVNSTPPGVNQVTLATPGRQAVVISDAPGPLAGVTLRASTGARITVSDGGIVIDNGRGASIALTGNPVQIHGSHGVESLSPWSSLRYCPSQKLRRP